MPKQETEKLQKIHDDIAEIKTALRGYNGQVGLCKQVEINTKEIRRLWIAVLVIVLSTGSGVFSILKVILP